MSLKGRMVIMVIGIAVLTTICVSAAFIMNLKAESERQVASVRQTMTADVERELKIETETDQYSPF